MPTTPGQRIWQGRFEALIGVAAPAFDVLLNAGDRASRLLLPIPFLHLFPAAQGRSTRAHAAMVGFVFIGPILFGAQGIVQAIGARQAATDFVNRPPEQSFKYAKYQTEVKQHADAISKVT